MKYMLLVYLDEQAMSDAEREHCYVESAQLAQELNSSGQYLDASPRCIPWRQRRACACARANGW
ncbi:MAG TPA: hypothetical protein VF899_23010 [Pyrinomonadaceae bacterium]